MRALIVLALALLCGCGGESALEIRAFLPNADGPVHAVSYGPHRDGQRPGGLDPSVAELREDLHLMADHWSLIRLYGGSVTAENILNVIREDDLEIQVMLGAWIAPDAEAANRAEVDTAIRLANAFPEIVAAVSVGNETQVEWSAHCSSLEGLIEHIRRVRAGVSVPVTTADDFNFWNKPRSRVLDTEVDFLALHAHPLWNGLQLEGALPWLDERLAEVQALHPDLRIVLAETGWATSVGDEGEQARLIKGVAGEAEQKIFYRESLAWADARDLVMFTFEAFDENWKGGTSPAEVEKHWGLFHADRTPKAALDPHE